MGTANSVSETRAAPRSIPSACLHHAERRRSGLREKGFDETDRQTEKTRALAADDQPDTRTQIAARTQTYRIVSRSTQLPVAAALTRSQAAANLSMP